MDTFVCQHCLQNTGEYLGKNDIGESVCTKCGEKKGDRCVHFPDWDYNPIVAQNKKRNYNVDKAKSITKKEG
jgi:hypothetical protein